MIFKIQGNHSQCISAVFHYEILCHKCSPDDYLEYPVVAKPSEHIQFCTFELPAVYFVENLHEHKRVEHHSHQLAILLQVFDSI